MKLFKWGVAAVITVSLALYFTKPSPQDVEAFVHAQALSQLQARDLKPSAGAVANVALVGCKLRPDTCPDVLRRLIDIRYDDKTLYARVTVTGIGPANRCYAVFNQLICTGTEPQAQ